MGNISLIKARSYLLGYRFIIQYDMIYVAWFMRHDEAAGNISLAWQMGIKVLSSKDIFEVNRHFPPPNTRPSVN